MKKLHETRFYKRVVSMAAAAAMLVTSMPVSELSDGSRYLFNHIKAAAETVEKYPIEDGECIINSFDELIAYSKSYQEYAGEYENIDIVINLNQTTLDNISDFVSIGTADNPFSADIYFTLTNTKGLVLDKPLFNYVHDSCHIYSSDAQDEFTLKLTRVSGDASPLYADNVIHDTNSSGNILNIVSDIKTDSDFENIVMGDHSGVIGNFGADAQLELNFTNNSDKDITGSGDVGLLCGIMEANSTLDVTISGKTSYSVTSTGGSAGGLVGSMASGSKLNINSDITTSGTINASEYAGGLVGSAENSAVNFTNNVTVDGTVSGGSGSGGVFGYYEAKADLTVSNYKVNCTVNGGNAGGIFGELRNNGGTVTIDSTNSVIVSGYGTNFGGLVGFYNADSSSRALEISGSKVTVTKNGTATNYGGVIGATQSNAYVKCSSVTVNATGCNSGVTSFGGFIGSNGGGMLDVEDLTVVQNDGGSGFLGGGVVGTMTAGVLQLSGTTDLSGTKCDESGKGKYGQIVGTRGNQTLIYALKDWTLIRSTTPVQADDIGTWGEVLRFSDTFNIDEVLTIDNHTVTVKEITVTDKTKNEVTVSSVEEFAIVSLNLKAKAGTANNALKFSNTDTLKNVDASATLNMTLTSDIDLTGTGITGLYRDDGCNAKGDNGVYCFKGSIIGVADENGNYPTITLAAGEPYGKRKKDSNSEAEIIDSIDETNGNGRIYNHRYSGLVSKIYGKSELKNFNVNGIIHVQSKSAASANDMFVGSVAAQSVTDYSVIFENVTTDVNINIISKDNINTRCGGLIGELYYTRDEIIISECTIASDITIGNYYNNKVYAGGVFGNILANKPNFTINVENSKIMAKIINSNTNNKLITAGGLIANIAGHSNDSSQRKINLNNVTLDGVKIENCNGSALLGTNWYNVDVTFGGDKGGLTVNNCTLTGSNSDFAGLVTQGSGYWQVNDVDINNITVSGENGAGAFGMFVNKGHTTYTYSSTSYSKSLYLEFTDKDAYKISGDNITLSSNAIFDEILVYAHSRGSGSIAANGDCAVVSIHAEDSNGTPTVIMDGENCNTYQNQTNYANDNDKKFNQYVRYYYNLDYIRDKKNKGTTLSAPEKLLLWSVNRYAHESIKSYFDSDFVKTTDNEDGSKSVSSTILPGDYNMKGYSYYPVDNGDTVIIDGTAEKPAVFTFYNSEFDASEGKGESRLSYNSNNQHYLMQNGLFRDCSGSLTVKNATFRGNVGEVIKGSNDSGALIRGIIAGSAASPAEIECNNIVLDGIIVNGVSDSTTYAPLLINKVYHDAKLTINGITTTAAYNEGETTKTAAGCLIGNIGFNDYNNANNIKLVFNNIKLDSRAKRFTDNELNSAFDTAYKTKKSIFKNSTILNAFSYPEGKNCSAIYNYKYNEDWDESGNPQHNVTYGKEITASEQYKDLERNYLNSQYYTDPENPANDSNANNSKPYNFDNGYFLPYVKEKFSTNSGNKFYEIKVNVASPNLDKGCGTYNDPYIIEKANQLMLVADILGGVDTFSDGTTINYRADNYKTWCEDNTNASHCMYVWDSAASKFYPPEMENGEAKRDVLGNPIPDKTKTAVDAETIKNSLSTAYYQLSGDITLGKSFTGLGKTTAFMGVIDGNNKTITNESVNPIIYNSTGSVVKDLTVNVTAGSISLTSSSSKSAYDTDGSGGTPVYGGLIGIVNGGDNIIDNVSVAFGEETEISVGTGKYSGNIAVGGYIGAVRYGGVVFRNMTSANKTGLTSAVCSDVLEGSKSFLYINPIIGRVIDGFAVTESDSYKPREENVTMKNGTKNYSIADIDTSADKITFNNGTINVPDGQALFLIGCITNSGAGKFDASSGKYNSDYNLFGYGKTNQMVRHGSYANVGDVTKTDFDAHVESGDSFGGSVVPYLIYQYTENGSGSPCEYPARTLTSNTAAFYISLAQNGDYVLPDGFRGIGSVNDTSGGSQMYIHGIDGNNSVIKMNIQYQLYNNGTDYYDTQNSGIGLFNILCQNVGGSVGEDIKNYTISDFTISGNVALKRYNTNGTEVTTNNGTISAGGLGGLCYSGECSVLCDNIALDGLAVSSTYNAGGLLGTAEPETAVNASLKCISAEGLSVTAARQAGGFVGYSKNIAYTVNGKNGGSNSSFKIDTVQLTDTDSKLVSENLPVPRAAGGLFGLFNENASLDLSGMDIERYGDKGVIELKSGVTLNENCLGGILGYMSNSGSVKIDGCNVKNISIKNGSRCGGLIGIVFNKSGVTNTVKILNTDMLAENCVISSSCPSGKTYANSGGLCGYSNTTVKIDGCSVIGYTISSENSEGCAGFVTKSDGTLTASNSLVKDCTLKRSGSNYVGAFLGCNGGNGFKGYNLVSDNVQMTDIDGNALNKNVGGDIVGYNSKTLQLVGVSVQKDEGGKYASKSVGGTFNSANGYVIYSDYNGGCCGGTANTKACGINSSEADVKYKSPYATINPKTNIDSSMFLTGDGAGGKETIDAILADTEKYKNVSADKTAFKQFKDKVSTYNTETGAGLERDFPVLVVNDSKDVNVTNLINSYIHLVTNDAYITNYAASDDSKYKVEISRYRMNSDTKAFEEVRSGEQALKLSNGYFGMSNKEYDTDYTQFTLLDVQYLAPNDASKVAYHLYIPVLVEKLLKYDFTAEILSGTNYRASDYEDKKAVMESYGSPVTVYLEYSYQRTVGEWQTAIDLGENLLDNYGKTVLLASGNESHLPESTELVLVDRNNFGRPYYSTVSTAVSSNLLSFDKFKSSDGEAFEPLTLLELLEGCAVLSAEQSEDGKYIMCDSADKNALVKVGDTYYKLKPEGSADETTYSITITAMDGSLSQNAVLPITESYYISFFTPKRSDLPMVDITAMSAPRLDDTGMKTPSHVTSVNSGANMILGDLYEQELVLSVTNADEVMTESNNTLTASLSSAIRIKNGNAKETVKTYLKKEEISLYHGFNIELNITDESGMQKGVKGDPYVTGSYLIGPTSYNISETCTGSSVELYAQSGGQAVDISKALADSADGITIKCNEIKITYDPSGLMEQFPIRPDDNDSYGVHLSAASNLAYTPESVSHSTISAVSTNEKKYYRQGEVTVAQLNYNIPTGTIDADEFSKLGVNGNEPSENITAVGYYDVSEISGEEIENARKVSVTLSLLQKDADGGYVPVGNISDYLENIRLYGKDSDAVLTAKGNTVSAEFLKDELVFENNIFEINTGYTAITGAAFEEKGFTYSNYKVLMTVQLLDGNGNSVTNSSCSDHIIYTNARIYTEFLNASA